jgi:hypothetical protein
MIMRSTSYTRAAATVLALALGAMPLVVAPAAAKPSDKVRRSAFSLFAVPIDILQVNNVFCPVSNRGKVCVNQNDNPLLEGGFWPRGTPDSYIYNSGLQIGGVILNSPFTGGTADTVGVYFMDPRGSQFEGEGLTNVYNSANTSDQAAWPIGGVARDTALYNAVLVGRNVVSQQDLWVRVWDGNPANTIGGSHPLGIVVDQRGMAWNYPTGNEDIVYFIYTVYNVSASNPAKYNNPTIDFALRPEIAAIGAKFKGLNDQHYGVTIPADGYDITNAFLAFFEDCDVGVNSGSNYSTANFVFNMGFCWKSDFNDPPPAFTYPPDIFSAPLFAGVGFTGVKYLRSPLGNNGKELGLTLFSNTGNPTSSGGAGYIDPRGGKQLYRYLSGTSSPAAGDNSCTNQGQQLAKRFCFLFQQPVDTRFFMSSGPFTLPAGESRTIVVAYVMAAALGTQFTAGCAVGGDCHAGAPASPAGLLTGDSVRTIDKLAGWVSASDNNGDGVITQNEVTTFPRTLYNKSLVAQTVFDNKFLLPFSPEQPEFFLIPGDSSVSITWRPSVTEAIGDPYFAVASDPTSLLYDPNFRHFDVEGYRIYRGRSPSNLQLIAQFDYAGTVFQDFTGGMAYPAKCAPELGVVAVSATGCPVAFPANFQPGVSPAVNPTVHKDQPLVGDVVQVRMSRNPRVQLIDGSIRILSADTAVTGGGSGNPPLKDTGVPFGFVDHDPNLRNSITYYYAVTAFDLNSLQSGPSSLESPKTTLKTATPRHPSANAFTPAGPVTLRFTDKDGNALNPKAAPPTIDSIKGTFSGPAAPTGNFQQLGLTLLAGQLLVPHATAAIRIDSVVPGFQLVSYFLTGLGGLPTTSQFGPGGTLEGSVTFGPVGAVIAADTTVAKRQKLGLVPFAATFNAQIIVGPTTETSKDIDWHNDVNGSFFAFPDGIPNMTNDGGSRWFDGANETMADPTLGLLHGQVTGVTTIYRPTAFENVGNNTFRRFDQETRMLFRAADIKFYWGTTPGTVDSVLDVTHHVLVPFSPQNRASYGFRSDVVGTGIGSVTAPDNIVSYVDFLQGACLPGAAGVDNTACDTRGYVPAATLGPVDVTGDGAADGNGFGLYVNGEPFIFLTAALPVKPAVWTLRTYFGLVVKDTITHKYSYAPVAANPPIPGLRWVATTTTPAVLDTTTTSDSMLAHVHTLPDPYYVTNALEISPNTKVLKFVNLPARCIIRIYSTSAILVRVLTHDDPTGGSEESWNLRNRNNQFVASGVYFYHVETPDGKTKVGRFTIVNFAP